MSMLDTLWGDLKKIFAFAPLVAVVAPGSEAAEVIAKASAAASALQPVVQAVHDANGGNLTHADLVAKVTDAVAQSSTALSAQGLLTGSTTQHLEATAQAIHAAVAISGLASDATK